MAQLFEKASALGYAESSYMLGFLYDNPEVGIMDSIKARHIMNFQQSMVTLKRYTY